MKLFREKSHSYFIRTQFAWLQISKYTKFNEPVSLKKIRKFYFRFSRIDEIGNFVEIFVDFAQQVIGNRNVEIFQRRESLVVGNVRGVNRMCYSVVVDLNFPSLDYQSNYFQEGHLKILWHRINMMREKWSLSLPTLRLDFVNFMHALQNLHFSWHIWHHAWNMAQIRFQALLAQISPIYHLLPPSFFISFIHSFIPPFNNSRPTRFRVIDGHAFRCSALLDITLSPHRAFATLNFAFPSTIENSHDFWFLFSFHYSNHVAMIRKAWKKQ